MNLEKAKLDPPLHFPDWPAALAATGWPPDQQAAVSATVRWSLSSWKRVSSAGRRMTPFCS
jgi:hypothetical protein